MGRPLDHLRKHGLVDYDKVFRCKKNHKYIDTCIKHNFDCTVEVNGGTTN